MTDEIIKKIKEETAGSAYYKNYSFENKWADIPIITKEDVVKNFSSIRSTFLDPKSNITINRTSGSSGTILHIPWKNNELLFSLKKLWNLRKSLGVSVSDTYVTCHAGVYVNNNRLLNHKIIVDKNCHSFSKIHMQKEDIAKYVEYMQQIHPTWMLLQPSVAYTIGQYLYTHNINIASLKLIELTGEALTPTVYNALKTYYGNIFISNNYGMQEFGGIAYCSNSCDDLCIIENNVYVEILDDNDNLLPDGKEGRIVVTGLTNSLFPLIRYDSGDRGCITRENEKIKLHLTESRSNDSFIYKNKRYDASIFFNLTEHLNDLGANIIQFQFQYRNNDLEAMFFIMKKHISSEEIKSHIENFMYGKYGIVFDSIKLNFSNDFIRNYEANKTKYFINHNITTYTFDK